MGEGWSEKESKRGKQKKWGNVGGRRESEVGTVVDRRQRRVSGREIITASLIGEEGKARVRRAEGG